MSKKVSGVVIFVESKYSFSYTPFITYKYLNSIYLCHNRKQYRKQKKAAARKHVYFFHISQIKTDYKSMKHSKRNVQKKSVKKSMSAHIGKVTLDMSVPR